MKKVWMMLVAMFFVVGVNYTVMASDKVDHTAGLIGQKQVDFVQLLEEKLAFKVKEVNVTGRKMESSTKERFDQYLYDSGDKRQGKRYTNWGAIVKDNQVEGVVYISREKESVINAFDVLTNTFNFKNDEKIKNFFEGLNKLDKERDHLDYQVDDYYVVIVAEKGDPLTLTLLVTPNKALYDFVVAALR